MVKKLIPYPQSVSPCYTMEIAMCLALSCSHSWSGCYYTTLGYELGWIKSNKMFAFTIWTLALCRVVLLTWYLDHRVT